MMRRNHGLVLEVHISGRIGVSYVLWPNELHDSDVHEFKQVIGTYVLNMDDLDQLINTPVSIPSLSLFPLAHNVRPFSRMHQFDRVYLGHSALSLGLGLAPQEGSSLIKFANPVVTFPTYMNVRPQGGFFETNR